MPAASFPRTNHMRKRHLPLGVTRISGSCALSPGAAITPKLRLQVSCSATRCVLAGCAGACLNRRRLGSPAPRPPAGGATYRGTRASSATERRAASGTRGCLVPGSADPALWPGSRSRPPAGPADPDLPGTCALSRASPSPDPGPDPADGASIGICRAAPASTRAADAWSAFGAVGYGGGGIGSREPPLAQPTAH